MKESREKVISIVIAVLMIAMMVIAKVAPAEVRFWCGFFPLGIIVCTAIGLLLGAGVDVLGRWSSTIVLVVAASLLLVGTQIASQDLAGKADDLKDYTNLAVLRGLIWWGCSMIPMIAGTVSAWRKPRPQVQ